MAMIVKIVRLLLVGAFTSRLVQFFSNKWQVWFQLTSLFEIVVILVGWQLSPFLFRNLYSEYYFLNILLWVFFLSKF